MSISKSFNLEDITERKLGAFISNIIDFPEQLTLFQKCIRIRIHKEKSYAHIAKCNNTLARTLTPF